MSTGLSDIPKFNFASCFLCIVGKQFPPYVPKIHRLDYPAATIRSCARNKMHDTFDHEQVVHRKQLLGEYLTLSFCTKL